MRERTSADGNKARMHLLRRFHEVVDQAVVISEDRVLLRQPGNEDHAVRVIPPGLVVRIVCGIAAGRVMHDDKSAKLIECGAKSEVICRVGRKDSLYDSHILLFQ